MNTVYLISSKYDAYVFLRNVSKQKFNIEETEIARKPHGKPYFKNSDKIYFNISDSYDLKAVAIGECEVGVDIEKIRKVNLSVAKRFTEQEREYILKQDCEKRLLEVWTKKEAYLKYKGVGLSGRLDSFNVFDLPEKIKTFFIGDYIVSVCSKKDYELEVQNEIRQNL